MIDRDAGKDPWAQHVTVYGDLFLEGNLRDRIPNGQLSRIAV